MCVCVCVCVCVCGVQVYALSAVTGAKVWSYSTNDEVKTTPALADGVLFVGSDDGNMYAFGVPRQHGIAALPPDSRALVRVGAATVPSSPGGMPPGYDNATRLGKRQ